MEEINPKDKEAVNLFKVDEKYFNEIKIHRNALPDDLYEELYKKYRRQPLTYGWKSHKSRFG